MAAGRIALAFDRPRSGMGWVGQLVCPGRRRPRTWRTCCKRLADQPVLRQKLSAQTRERYRTLLPVGVVAAVATVGRFGGNQ